MVIACRVVIGALLRRLQPSRSLPLASAEQSASGQQRGHRPSAGHEHAARHRFHAIQRHGSCGYDASDRRRRSPEPKLVGSARRNSPRAETFRTRAIVQIGIHGLVRAHESVNPFGLALRSPARTELPLLPGCRASDAGDGSAVEVAPVPPARRLSAHQYACPASPLGLFYPVEIDFVRSARTHAPAPRACVQIAPDRPSVAGTPADKRFGNGASDTSKINFKGVHQTGSTPGQVHNLGDDPGRKRGRACTSRRAAGRRRPAKRIAPASARPRVG